MESHAPKIRARTLYGYQNVLKRYVLPPLGDVPLDTVTASGDRDNVPITAKEWTFPQDSVADPPDSKEGAQTGCSLESNSSKSGGPNPNPPKDTDGRREESGRGVRELQGNSLGSIWGREVGGRSSSPVTGAPMAVCGSCDARDGERIRSRGTLSDRCWRESAGIFGCPVGGSVADGAVRPGVRMARSRAKARLNFSAQWPDDPEDAGSTGVPSG